MLSVLLNALPGTISQGLIWAILAIGVYLTFRVLDIPDMTVDGSFATGGAAMVMLMRNGLSPWLALALAFLVGYLAGTITGLLHTLWDTSHLSRHSFTACPLLCQPTHHGWKSQPAAWRGQIRSHCLTTLCARLIAAKSALFNSLFRFGRRCCFILFLRHRTGKRHSRYWLKSHHGARTGN